MINQSKNLSGTWLRGATIAGGLVLAAILGGALFRSSAVHAQLQDWKLIPSPKAYPDGYTELYFDRNLSLPTTVSKQPVVFEFSIHNMQGQTTNYPYTVALVSTSGIVRVLSHGTISLTNGGVANVPEAFTLPVGTKDSEISVELPEQNQEIHFWLGVAK